MRSLFLVVGGLAFLAALGCRSDPNVALLERELRIQEDEIYRLQDELAQRQAAEGRFGTAEKAPDNGDSMLGPLDILIPNQDKPITEGPFIDEPSGGEPPRWPGADQTPIEEPTPLEPVEPDLPVELNIEEPQTTGPALSAGGRQVTSLILDEQLTGGYDADGQPGDEGITAVIELQDSSGQPALTPGEVSVVALDPELEGEAARVARWDFTADEIAAGLRQGGRAIRLQMPWPAEPPQHDLLYVFVRYTARDGRQLQTDGAIEINRSGQPTAGWQRAPRATTARQACQSPPPQALEPTPATPLSEAPPVRVAARPSTSPTEPQTQRPVWSPERR